MELSTRVETVGLDFFYGTFKALKNVSIRIPDRTITSIIGPSGCGKSTLLRCFNRMNDLVESARAEGKILVDGQNILDPATDLIVLRKKVGMVFQRPNVFDLSIYNNLKFGLRIHRMFKRRSEIREAIQDGLEHVGLWDELKDKLNTNARLLSLEQRQRLCIARVIILKPQVILFDEPCSALDPISTLRVEDLLRELKTQYTIIIVTHNMQQAARVSDFTGFMYLGELIEFSDTRRIFTNPRQKLTEEYISGDFG
jgi:phosphate transport system ATP-binding protein